MNRLVIIGNGFDMAHGFKTSYMDFINWYWDQRVYTFSMKVMLSLLQAQNSRSRMMERTQSKHRLQMARQKNRKLQVHRKVSRNLLQFLHPTA